MQIVIAWTDRTFYCLQTESFHGHVDISKLRLLNYTQDEEAPAVPDDGSTLSAINCLYQATAGFAVRSCVL